MGVENLWSEITPGTPCRIMKLTLGEHSKQGVLDAVKVLESREDIHSAEPRFMYAVSGPAPESRSWPIWAGAAVILLIAAGVVAAVILRRKSK